MHLKFIRKNQLHSISLFGKKKNTHSNKVHMNESLSCILCEIFKKTFCTEHLRATAYGLLSEKLDIGLGITVKIVISTRPVQWNHN